MTTGYYYEGMPYQFNETDHRNAGWLRKGICKGYKLVLDPLEDSVKCNGILLLKYPPKVLYVKLDNSTFTRLTSSSADGVVPLQMEKVSFDLKLLIPQMFEGKKHDHLVISREAFKIQPAISITEFTSQGTTFRDLKGFIDARIPPGTSTQSSALLVMLSRFTSWDHIALLCPLWDTPQEKNEVCMNLWNHVQPSEDLKAEKLCFQECIRLTKLKYPIFQ